MVLNGPETTNPETQTTNNNDPPPSMPAETSGYGHARVVYC